MQGAKTSIKIEDLLEKVRASVISVPCPECGGICDKPISPGGQIKCEFCGSTYTIETYLDTATHETLKSIVSNVIEDALHKYGIVLDESLKGLTSQLSQYATKVLDGVKSFYESHHRLPSEEEVDQEIKGETQKILQSIASVSQELLKSQSTLSVKIDEVTGKIDSIQVLASEIQKFFSHLEEEYETKIQLKREPLLLFKGENGKVEKIKLDEAIIGRNENTHVIEIRFADGRIKPLGIIDPTVSRQHIKITIKNGKIVVTDLKSKNGTIIDSVKILPNKPYELSSEAKITLGFNTQIELKFV